MSLVQRLLSILREDSLLRRVIKNSSFLFGSNSISAILTFVQGILTVRMVDVSGLGLLTAVMTYASNVNRLLSFRMSEVVVKRMGQALANGDKEEAAAVVKTAALTEIFMSLLAYAALFLTARWAAVTFAKDSQTTSWFIFYGLILLADLVYETSTGVLQTTRRFDRLARINLVQSVVTAACISATFVLNIRAGGMAADLLLRNVLAAYLLGKAYAGVSIMVSAFSELNSVLLPHWWKTPFQKLSDPRGMAWFAVNTNFNGTVNLFVRDNVPLYMAYLLGPTEVGYLKLALTFIVPITMLLDPFIWPTYAEITRTVAERQWQITLRLLRRVSVVTASVVLALGGGLTLVGWWLIPTLYGESAFPAYPALLILLVGYGVANILQWNRPLLLALGRPSYPLLAAALAGVVELILIFTLVPRYGYLMMAAILSGYFVVSIGMVVLRGLAIIRRQQALPPE